MTVLAALVGWLIAASFAGSLLGRAVRLADHHRPRA